MNGQHGLVVGDRVAIGGGKKHWTILFFWTAPDGDQLLARLAPVEGYGGYTVDPARLKAVTQ